MRYAGFWRRSVAHLIDFLLTQGGAILVEEALFALMYAVYWLIQKASHGPISPYADAFNPVLEQVVSVIVYLAVAIPYYVWGTSRYGTTLGKRVVKVRVVRFADGGPISMRQSALRFVGYLASYATLGCGFFMAAFHPHKRCLHDLIAGTASVITD
jgi:uncharacterized RDD family membrane protein YckC